MWLFACGLGLAGYNVCKTGLVCSSGFGVLRVKEDGSSRSRGKLDWRAGNSGGSAAVARARAYGEWTHSTCHICSIRQQDSSTHLTQSLQYDELMISGCYTRGIRPPSKGYLYGFDIP